ncbi:AraC family transcriptional regulator [Oscillatoria sp. FACHB-1407]|nr:AraC family transcriptional regulator [Oscillatoria sp. FACHB-1407]
MNIGIDFAELWQPNISGIELFSAHIVRHAFAKHFHETYTIGMNDAGLGEFWYRGQTCCAVPNSFNLINPGEVHTGQAASNQGWTFRNIYISTAQVHHILTQLEWCDRPLPAFIAPIVWDQSLRSHFHRLFVALSQPTSHLTRESLLLEAFSQLLLRHTQSHLALRSPKPETKAIAIVRDYLETHYAESVSIDVLAKLAGLSPYYLIRTFHQQVGLPPHRYQRHWQLLQAKRSLCSTKSLSEIAVEHGFYDQSHLNRLFKQAFGITPGQYQKRNSVQYESEVAL